MKALEWSQHNTAIYRRCSSTANSVIGGREWWINSLKFLWVSLLPARMRKIHSKMKVLESSKKISHCKSMQIFYDAQGQLNQQSEAGSI